MPDLQTWGLPLAAPPAIEVIGYGRIQRGQAPTYRFARLWSLHLYRYRCAMRLPGGAVSLKPGMAGLVAPGTPFSFTYHEDGLHPYALFALPPGPEERVAAGVTLASEAYPLWLQMSVAIAEHPLRPARASSLLWDVLWRIAACGSRPEDQDLPAAVRDAIARVVAEPGRPPEIGELARGAGLAPDSLSRLFRRHLGLSAKSWIQRHRRERLRRLLASGDIPLASIADDIGCSDAQELNKLCRSWFGAPPTRVRREGFAPTA